MKFEGSEKKFEVILSSNSPSLLDRENSFWDKLVLASRASVLSRIDSSDGFALLLSESSLFVFRHRVIMITCGQTRLIDALLMLLDSLSLDLVDVVVYERKNELFPQNQSTTFDDDVEELSRRIEGTTLVLGDKSAHYVALFHSTKPYTPAPNDSTFELLMQDIDNGICSLFTMKPVLCAEVMHRRSRVNNILPDFIIDDHVFNPCGYSLNAIKDEYYYTLHITPESDCSYVSFETNYPFKPGRLMEAATEVLSLFKPKSFAFVAFEKTVHTKFEDLGYSLAQTHVKQLDSGYTVHYQQFEFSK